MSKPAGSSAQDAEGVMRASRRHVLRTLGAVFLLALVPLLLKLPFEALGLWRDLRPVPGVISLGAGLLGLCLLMILPFDLSALRRVERALAGEGAEVVWLYQRRAGSWPILHTSAVVIGFADGKRAQLRLSTAFLIFFSREVGRECALVSERFPHAVMGHSAELDKRFRKDPGSFGELVVAGVS